MNNAIFRFNEPENEQFIAYEKGSKERLLLEKEIERQSNIIVEIPLIIGGKEIRTGNTGKVVMPHNHKHVLATYHKAGENEVRQAMDGNIVDRKSFNFAQSS